MGPRLAVLRYCKHQSFQRRTATTIAHRPELQKTYDSIVVGSGCAGLTAAAVMAKHGLKVLVVEKTGYFGGTTAYSGGGAWIPANKHQPVLGIEDSVSNGETYLRQVMGSLYDEETTRMKAFLQSGPEMIEWMEANTSVKFKPMPLPDYHINKAGASVGRAVYTEEFNGRLLGRRVKQVRYPLQGYSAFGTMQADFSDWTTLTNPFKNIRNLAYTTSKVVNYGWDLLRYGKGAAMANGNALVGRMIHSLLQHNVDLETNTSALRTIMDDDKNVVGLVVEKDGEETTYGASRGVVLASGGFGRSEEAKQYVPHEWCVSPRGNVGDGKRIGVESGGTVGQPNRDNAIFSPISLLKPKKGPVRRYPHFAIDRSKPGSIIVGPDGRRFANESEPYQEFVSKMHEMKIDKAFFIADHHFLRKYGMGMALPWPYPINRLLRQGYLIKASTIEELARAIDVPEIALSKTVEECNQHAITGHDSQFQRGDNIYDQFYGDPSVHPNHNLGPCAKAPFYALPLYPGNVSTMYGLSTDENARVLGEDGRAVTGLFAVGCDQNSVMRGTYPGGGCSIGPGMTFGYRAGKYMVSH